MDPFTESLVANTSPIGSPYCDPSQRSIFTRGKRQSVARNPRSTGPDIADESSMDIYGDIIDELPLSDPFQPSSVRQEKLSTEEQTNDQRDVQDRLTFPVEQIDDKTDGVSLELSEMEKLRNKIKELEVENKNLKCDNKALNANKIQLTKNISCLFLTSQSELKRKDKEIETLRNTVKELQVQVQAFVKPASNDTYQIHPTDSTSQTHQTMTVSKGSRHSLSQSEIRSKNVKTSRGKSKEEQGNDEQKTHLCKDSTDFPDLTHDSGRLEMCKGKKPSQSQTALQPKSSNTMKCKGKKASQSQTDLQPKSSNTMKDHHSIKSSRKRDNDKSTEDERRSTLRDKSPEHSNIDRHSDKSDSKSKDYTGRHSDKRKSNEHCVDNYVSCKEDVARTEKQVRSSKVLQDPNIEEIYANKNCDKSSENERHRKVKITGLPRESIERSHDRQVSKSNEDCVDKCHSAQTKNENTEKWGKDEYKSQENEVQNYNSSKFVTSEQSKLSGWTKDSENGHSRPKRHHLRCSAKISKEKTAGSSQKFCVQSKSQSNQEKGSSIYEGGSEFSGKLKELIDSQSSLNISQTIMFKCSKNHPKMADRRKDKCYNGEENDKKVSFLSSSSMKEREKDGEKRIEGTSRKVDCYSVEDDCVRLSNRPTKFTHDTAEYEMKSCVKSQHHKDNMTCMEDGGGMNLIEDSRIEFTNLKCQTVERYLNEVEKPSDNWLKEEDLSYKSSPSTSNSVTNGMKSTHSFLDQDSQREPFPQTLLCKTVPISVSELGNARICQQSFEGISSSIVECQEDSQKEARQRVELTNCVINSQDCHSPSSQASLPFSKTVYTDIPMDTEEGVANSQVLTNHTWPFENRDTSTGIEDSSMSLATEISIQPRDKAICKDVSVKSNAANTVRAFPIVSLENDLSSIYNSLQSSVEDGQINITLQIESESSSNSKNIESSSLSSTTSERSEGNSTTSKEVNSKGSSDSKTTENSSSDSKTTENSSSDSKPTENNSSDSKTTENSSSDSKTTENSSSDSKPTENNSSDSKTTENSSSDSKRTENSSSDSKTIVNSSSDSKTTENNSCDSKTTENNSCDSKTTENNSNDSKTTENNSNDSKTTENNSNDSKTTENNLNDSKTTENNSNDSKTTENNSNDSKPTENNSNDSKTTESSSSDSQKSIIIRPASRDVNVPSPLKVWSSALSEYEDCSPTPRIFNVITGATPTKNSTHDSGIRQSPLTPLRSGSTIMCTPNLIMLGDEEATSATIISPFKSHSVPSEFIPPGVRKEIKQVNTHHRHIRGEPELLHDRASPSTSCSRCPSFKGKVCSDSSPRVVSRKKGDSDVSKQTEQHQISNKEQQNEQRKDGLCSLQIVRQILALDSDGNKGENEKTVAPFVGIDNGDEMEVVKNQSPTPMAPIIKKAVKDVFRKELSIFKKEMETNSADNNKKLASRLKRSVRLIKSLSCLNEKPVNVEQLILSHVNGNTIVNPDSEKELSVKHMPINMGHDMSSKPSVSDEEKDEKKKSVIDESVWHTSFDVRPCKKLKSAKRTKLHSCRISKLKSPTFDGKSDGFSNTQDHHQSTPIHLPGNNFHCKDPEQSSCAEKIISKSRGMMQVGNAPNICRVTSSSIHTADEDSDHEMCVNPSLCSSEDFLKSPEPDSTSDPVIDKPSKESLPSDLNGKKAASIFISHHENVFMEDVSLSPDSPSKDVAYFKRLAVIKNQSSPPRSVKKKILNFQSCDSPSHSVSNEKLLDTPTKQIKGDLYLSSSSDELESDDEGLDSTIVSKMGHVSNEFINGCGESCKSYPSVSPMINKSGEKSPVRGWDELSLMETNSLSEFDGDVMELHKQARAVRGSSRATSISSHISVGGISPFFVSSPRLSTPSHFRSPKDMIWSPMNRSSDSHDSCHQDIFTPVSYDDGNEGNSQANNVHESNFDSVEPSSHQLSRHLSFAELQELNLVKSVFVLMSSDSEEEDNVDSDSQDASNQTPVKNKVLPGSKSDTWISSRHQQQSIHKSPLVKSKVLDETQKNVRQSPRLKARRESFGIDSAEEWTSCCRINSPKKSISVRKVSPHRSMRKKMQVNCMRQTNVETNVHETIHEEEPGGSRRHSSGEKKNCFGSFLMSPERSVRIVEDNAACETIVMGSCSVNTEQNVHQKQICSSHSVLKQSSPRSKALSLPINASNTENMERSKNMIDVGKQNGIKRIGNQFCDKSLVSNCDNPNAVYNTTTLSLQRDVLTTDPLLVASHTEFVNNVIKVTRRLDLEKTNYDCHSTFSKKSNIDTNTSERKYETCHADVSNCNRKQSKKKTKNSHSHTLNSYEQSHSVNGVKENGEKCGSSHGSNVQSENGDSREGTQTVGEVNQNNGKVDNKDRLGHMERNCCDETAGDADLVEEGEICDDESENSDGEMWNNDSSTSTGKKHSHVDATVGQSDNNPLHITQDECKVIQNVKSKPLSMTRRKNFTCRKAQSHGISPMERVYTPPSSSKMRKAVVNKGNSNNVRKRSLSVSPERKRTENEREAKPSQSCYNNIVKKYRHISPVNNRSKRHSRYPPSVNLLSRLKSPIERRHKSPTQSRRISPLESRRRSFPRRRFRSRSPAKVGRKISPRRRRGSKEDYGCHSHVEELNEVTRRRSGKEDLRKSDKRGASQPVNERLAAEYCSHRDSSHNSRRREDEVCRGRKMHSCDNGRKMNSGCWHSCDNIGKCDSRDRLRKSDHHPPSHSLRDDGMEDQLHYSTHSYDRRPSSSSEHSYSGRDSQEWSRYDSSKAKRHCCSSRTCHRLEDD